MTNLQPLNWPSAGKCLHCMLISTGTPRLVLHFLFLQKQKSSWFVTYFVTKVVRCEWYVTCSPFKVEVTWLSRMLDYSPLASSHIISKYRGTVWSQFNIRWCHNARMLYLLSDSVEQVMYFFVKWVKWRRSAIMSVSF